MNHIHTKSRLPVRGIGLGIALLLGVTAFTAGQEGQPKPRQEPVGAASLQVAITPPKDCFADCPAVFQLQVRNTGGQATADKMELVVSHGIMNLAEVSLTTGAFGGPGVSFSRRGGGSSSTSANPVRETTVTVPALAPNETCTIPVTLTPRRIGQFRLVVTGGGHMLGSASAQTTFDPNASLASLLPATLAPQTLRIPSGLADVPEVGLEDRASMNMKADEAFEHVAHMIEKINHANSKKADAFVATLLEKRRDISGLQMAMGDSCRLKPVRARMFMTELVGLREAVSGSPGTDFLNKLSNPAQFGQSNEEMVENATSVRIAALKQVLAPEGMPLRKEMIKYLSSASSAESNQTLANLAIFSEEKEIRQAALDVLKSRSEKDYSDVLVRGLSYPWPAVAQNVGEAIVTLKRKDLIPQLVATLERPDPRAPQTQDGRQVVREMVKINHLRNCLLCHAPGSTERTEQDRLAGSPVLLAQVPIPNRPLPSSPGSGYYELTVPDTLIRFDVTYLRQDFSVMLPVADHSPWPQNQRFDFLVRTREVTDQEAKAFSQLLRTAGDLSPYQTAAVAALRGLTGRDAEPNAAAWRKLLQQIENE